LIGRKLVVAGGGDKAIRFWEASTGNPLLMRRLTVVPSCVRICLSSVVRRKATLTLLQAFCGMRTLIVGGNLKRRRGERYESLSQVKGGSFRDLPVTRELPVLLEGWFAFLESVGRKFYEQPNPSEDTADQSPNFFRTR
jgi:hypothetical protein